MPISASNRAGLPFGFVHEIVTVLRSTAIRVPAFLGMPFAVPRRLASL